MDPADIEQLVDDSLQRHQVPADNSRVTITTSGNTVRLMPRADPASRDAVVGAAWAGVSTNSARYWELAGTNQE